MSIAGSVVYWALWLTLLQCQPGVTSTSVELYEKETWYLKAPATVVEYEGQLHYTTPASGPGGRVHHVSLRMKEGTYWIYDPDDKITQDFNGKKIRMIGKLINDPLSGIEHELWPGKMWVK